jgi:hypothetical protein
MFEYLKSLLSVKGELSTKSLSLLVSTVTGGIISLTLVYILIFDVITNGYIKTDLVELGIFLLCVGGYIAGSGIPKLVSDRAKNKFTTFQQDSNTKEAE